MRSIGDRMNCFRGANHDALTVYMELVHKILQSGRVCAYFTYTSRVIFIS